MKQLVCEVAIGAGRVTDRFYMNRSRKAARVTLPVLSPLSWQPSFME